MSHKINNETIVRVKRSMIGLNPNEKKKIWLKTTSQKDRIRQKNKKVWKLERTRARLIPIIEENKSLEIDNSMNMSTIHKAEQIVCPSSIEQKERNEWYQQNQSQILKSINLMSSSNLTENIEGMLSALDLLRGSDHLMDYFNYYYLQ